MFNNIMTFIVHLFLRRSSQFAATSLDSHLYSFFSSYSRFPQTDRSMPLESTAPPCALSHRNELKLLGTFSIGARFRCIRLFSSCTLLLPKLSQSLPNIGPVHDPNNRVKREHR